MYMQAIVITDIQSQIFQGSDLSRGFLASQRIQNQKNFGEYRSPSSSDN
jgi:hypothetical protein